MHAEEGEETVKCARRETVETGVTWDSYMCTRGLTSKIAGDYGLMNLLKSGVEFTPELVAFILSHGRVRSDSWTVSRLHLFLAQDVKGAVCTVKYYICIHGFWSCIYILYVLLHCRSFILLAFYVFCYTGGYKKRGGGSVSDMVVPCWDRLISS